MQIKKCPVCGQRQWSIADNNYVKLFNTCWSCDRLLWINKKLSLEEFEKREEDAANANPENL